MIRRLEERAGTVLFHLCIWTGCFLLVFLAYSFALKEYLLQDDFGFIVRHLPGGEVALKDAFRPEGIYYRPFTQHLWYFIVNPLFKLDPFWYHLANLIVQAANIILVYHIGRALTRSVNFGLFLGLIYGTRTLAYQAVVWPSAVNELLVCFFLFATFLAFQRYVANGSKVAWWMSVVAYLMAILSKENSLTLLPLMLVYSGWVHLPIKLDPSRLVKILKSLCPHILLVVILAAVKISQFAAIQASDYRMTLGKSTIRTYLKFFLSFTNPPPASIDYWKSHLVERGEIVLLVSVVISVILIGLWMKALGFKRVMKKQELGRNVSLWEIGSVRLFVFGCVWWLVSFLVTATMPAHAEQYYGVYPGFGLSLAVAAAFYDILLGLSYIPKTKVLGYCIGFFVIAFLITNYFLSVAGIAKIDWFRTAYLAKEAKYVADEMHRQLPDPEKGTHFIILEGAGDFLWVTSSGYEVKMIYDDLGIRVSFPTKESRDAILAKDVPDYYIRFTPNGVIPEMKPHKIEVGAYVDGMTGTGWE